MMVFLRLGKCDLEKNLNILFEIYCVNVKCSMRSMVLCSLVELHNPSLFYIAASYLYIRDVFNKNGAMISKAQPFHCDAAFSPFNFDVQAAKSYLCLSITIKSF